jgi:ubiquinone/menaquinone biosynthesis C-methylase UbiE
MRLYSAEKPWGDVLPRYAFLEPVFLNQKVLEIGCGDGSGAFFLKKRGAKEVVGTDLEGPELDAAKKQRKVRGVSFNPFDGQQLDSADSAFDVVIDFHLAAAMNPELLEEIRRVLKPEGYLRKRRLRQLTRIFCPACRKVSPGLRLSARLPSSASRWDGWVPKRRIFPWRWIRCSCPRKGRRWPTT